MTMTSGAASISTHHLHHTTTYHSTSMHQQTTSNNISNSDLTASSDHLRDLSCPSCKVTITVPEDRVRHICPYCGSFYDQKLEVSNLKLRRHSHGHISSSHRDRRSASPRLPNVAKNKESKDDGAIGSLLVSSLGSLTLGSLGMGSHNTDKLPKVPKDTKNRLVSVGGSPSHSGGETSKSTKDHHHHHGSKSSSSTKSIKNLYKDSINLETFKKMLEEAKSSKDYDKVQEFYSTTFKTALAVCSAFKQKPRQDGARLEDPELKTDFMYLVMDSIKPQPINIQKAVIRSIVQCLLEESSLLLSKDFARCLFILLQNPLFTSQVTAIYLNQWKINWPIRDKKINVVVCPLLCLRFQFNSSLSQLTFWSALLEQARLLIHNI